MSANFAILMYIHHMRLHYLFRLPNESQGNFVNCQLPVAGGNFYPKCDMQSDLLEAVDISLQPFTVKFIIIEIIHMVQ